MPKVSVVIPAYNAAETLPATLRSVLEQTFDDFEVLVIDDGSTDQTPEMARSADTNVMCVTTENGGVARARNSGIARARGRYVAFLDADDLWAPEKLERQVALMEQRDDVGACFATMVHVDQDLRPVRLLPAADFTDLTEALLLRSTVISGSCSSVMLRTELARTGGGFDPAFSQSADWEFFLRLSLWARFAPIAEPLVRGVLRHDSMSCDIDLLESDTVAVLDKFFAGEEGAAYLHLRRRSYSNNWMVLSGSYLHAGRRRDAVRCLLNGLRLHPANVGRPLGLPVRWAHRKLGRGVSASPRFEATR